MAIDTCLLMKAAEGIVSESKAKKLVKEIQDRVEEARGRGHIKTPADERLVAERLLKEKTQNLSRKKRMAVQHKRVLEGLDREYQIARDAGQPVDKLVMAYLSPDFRRRFGHLADVESRTSALRKLYQAKMSEVYKAFRSTYAGFHRDLSNLEPMIHEKFGKYGRDTGNPKAKLLAEQLTRATEYARQRYNAAGGDIPYREDWGWFQSHDPVRIAAVSEQEWMDFVKANLAMDRMTDVNGLPINPNLLDQQLKQIYSSIVTRGLSDMKAGPPGPKLLASNINQRANSRFLVFRDSDAWLAYEKKFGTGNIYENIITGMDRMARDTAMLEVLGPYPEATVRYMEKLIDKGFGEDAISKSGKLGSKAADKLGSPKVHLRALYNTVSGRTGITANSKWSQISADVRSIMTASALGGSWFAAIADTVTAGVTHRMNGVSPTRALGRVIHMFATNSTEDRLLAANLGFGVEGWASRAIQSQRVLGEAVGSRWTEVLADTALRLAWLSPWTEAGRLGNSVEMLSYLTQEAGKGFDQLKPETQRLFSTHGITPEDWDIFRNTPQWYHPDSGASFIRPEDVLGDTFEGRRFEVGNKVQTMLARELEYAIPSSNARVRAMFTYGLPAGTFWGEVMRNTAVFKSFPITIQATHWMRLMSEANPKTKAEYAAWLFLGMTAIGALGEQLTSISRGRDPESFASGGFWRRALVRGGSFGLLGDTLLADQSKYGSSLDTLLGPVWGLLPQVGGLTLGNIQQLYEGKDTNAGRELARFTTQNMPGHTTWYARLALERLIFDNLDRLLDPKAERQFSDMERKYYKERSQQFFSKPGSGAAQRLPDLGKMFEAAQ